MSVYIHARHVDNVYPVDMNETIVHARLPREVVEQLDERAEHEMRTRANLAAVLIRHGLRETTKKAS